MIHELAKAENLIFYINDIYPWIYSRYIYKYYIIWSLWLIPIPAHNMSILLCNRKWRFTSISFLSFVLNSMSYKISILHTLLPPQYCYWFNDDIPDNWWIVVSLIGIQLKTDGLMTVKSLVYAAIIILSNNQTCCLLLVHSG